MSLNFTEVFDLIETRRCLNGSIVEDMHAVIDCCETSCPHKDWAKLRTLPYVNDLEKLQSWLPKAFGNAQLKKPIIGLWFGIFNPVYRISPTADIRVSGSHSYDANDSDLNWAVDALFRPHRDTAKSTVMNGIYRQAYKNQSSLRNSAEWPLCLAYGVFLVKRLAVPEILPGLRAADSNVGIAVGFDGGDYVTIGTLSSSGLELAPKTA